MKTILLDIETSPNLAYCWEMYEQNVIAFEKQRELLSFSYKVLGQRKVYTYCLQNLTPLQLTKKLHEVFNEADVIIAHNGDSFDIKMSNAFFAHFNLTPPHPYKTVDTLKIARNKFRFNSNKLNDLGEYLGLGRKLDTGGFKLWLGCLKNDRRSWRLMKKYNQQDVVLLEKVYLKLRPWANTPVDPETSLQCPSCGSQNVVKRGWGLSIVFKRQRYRCSDCGKWSMSNLKIKHKTGEYLV